MRQPGAKRAVLTEVQRLVSEEYRQIPLSWGDQAGRAIVEGLHRGTHIENHSVCIGSAPERSVLKEHATLILLQSICRILEHIALKSTQERDHLLTGLVVLDTQSKRIPEIDRIPVCKPIQIQPTREPNEIFLGKRSPRRISANFSRLSRFRFFP